MLNSLNGIDEPGRLVDTIAAHMTLDLGQKQRVLELFKVGERLEHLIGLMDAEADLYQVEKKIRGRVKNKWRRASESTTSTNSSKRYKKNWVSWAKRLARAMNLNGVFKMPKCPKPPKKKTRAEINKLK